jgi:hypothetical protein
MIRQPRMVDDGQKQLLATHEGARNGDLVRHIPMREEWDAQGAPVMRFFSYDIPNVRRYMPGEGASDWLPRRLIPHNGATVLMR